MYNVSLADLPKRVAAKVAINATTGCWEWTATRQPDGYGKVKWASRMASAHRVAYELLVGPIPEGLEIDHNCRVRHCVNPVHMEPVTHLENVRRWAARNPVRQPLGGPAMCRNGHELAVVGVRPNGYCAECCRAATRRSHARRRLAA